MINRTSVGCIGGVGPRRLARLALCLSLAPLAALPACASQSVTEAARAEERGAGEIPADLAAPVAVDRIVEILPFRLREGFRYDWRAERPTITSGVIIVLKADPKLLAPRDAAEPVLYAGDETVLRLNRGDRSGHLIGIIPGDAVDFREAPIWFGRPDLPERVSAATIRDERRLADQAGIRPAGADLAPGVMREPVVAADLAALLRDHAADLVLRYAPDEKGLAQTWRLPTAGRG